MLRASLKGLAARRTRVALTILAVALGVALISGTYVLTDTINRSFDKIFQQAATGTDVSLTPRENISGADGGGTTPTLPLSLLRTVRAVDGVASASGTIFDQAAILDTEGKRLGGGGAPNFLASVTADRFSSFTFSGGRRPSGPREVALDRSTADRKHLKVGDRIQIVGRAPRSDYTIVSLTQFGGVTSFGGASIAVLTLPEAQRVLQIPGRVDQIVVAGRSGTTPDELRARLRAALPASVTVRTGQQEATKRSDDIKDNLSFLRTILLAFGFISLFVGAFIIFNTFSITVAQRLREFALLRTLGATRGQVLRAVLAEGLAIGLAGSLAGLGLGIALAPGLAALFRAFGIDLPSQGVVIETRTIVVALVLGTTVTLASGLVPAVRATRIPPIAALREGAVLPKGRGARLTTPLSLLLTLVGIGVLAIGLFGNSDSGTALPLIGGGAVVIFLGVALLSPRLVRPIAAAVGAPLEAVRGLQGRLARENTVRQAGRTAVTASALMIGVTLVAFVSIFAAGLKASISDAVDTAAVPGTLIIQNTDGFSAIPAAIAPALAKVPGVKSTSPVVFSNARVRGIGKAATVSAIDARTFTDVYRPRFKTGSPDDLRALDDGGVLLTKGYAEDHHLRVGDALHVSTPTAKRLTLRVKAITDDQGGIFADLTITDALARASFGEKSVAIVFAAVAPDDEKTVEPRVKALLKREYPVAEALTVKDFKGKQADQVDQLTGFLYVLLSLAVIVSLFGIVNTLALSIHERTREFGLLRAIGMSRRQVRTVVRYEAVITSMIGAVLGIVLGVLFAIAIAQPLRDDGFVLRIPVVTLAGLLVLGALAGVLAAILPARRAARLDVLEALAYE